MWPCPKCGGESELIHVEKSHFGTCKKCMVGWYIGRNLLTVPPMSEKECFEAMEYLDHNFTHIEA